MTDNHEPTGSQDRSSGPLANAKEAVSHGYAAAKEKATDAYDATRDRASDAYRSSREGLSSEHRAGDGLEQNPLAALAGGIAVGAVLGALLPRTRRETELLGSVGRVVAERARTATAAAKQAGQEKLDELGLNSATAKDKAASLVDAAKQVAGSAGAAASQAAKDGAATSAKDEGATKSTSTGDVGGLDTTDLPSSGTGGTSVLGTDDGTTDLYSGARSSEGAGDDRP